MCYNNEQMHNTMDAREVKNRYMAEYEKLVKAYESQKIPSLINDINQAISNSDVENINLIYNKISEWNDGVSNMQGARLAINSQYKYLKLPSVSEFLIVFDFVNKEWKFNTDPT